jgi:hypothetical protein
MNGVLTEMARFKLLSQNSPKVLVNLAETLIGHLTSRDHWDNRYEDLLNTSILLLKAQSGIEISFIVHKTECCCLVVSTPGLYSGSTSLDPWPRG